MSKYTTIAQIKADIEITSGEMLDFFSELLANTFGMAYLLVEMTVNPTVALLK